MGETTYRAARENMLENQIKARGITDPVILRAMGIVPRHLFVKEGYRARSYCDCTLPIGHTQVMSPPYVTAMMIELLKLKGDERILEIGTGSGYVTAVLAEIVSQVFTIERYSKLAQRSRLILSQLGYRNIIVKVGDGSLGWESHAPYDAIVVTAAGPRIPANLVSQLSDYGRMLMPVGSPDSQNLFMVEKLNSRAEVDVIEMDKCVFAPLIGEDAWLRGNRKLS